jgi:hypothetical protein
MPIQLRGKGNNIKKGRGVGPTELVEQSPAQEAVARFEKEYKVLLEMKQEFRDEFPEADRALQDILRQEDLVRQSIKDAHPLVQQARETIGPFKCVPKWTTPGYDDKDFNKLVVEFENGGDILIDLMRAGVAMVSLDKKATEHFAQNPELAEAFKAAWREKQEKTAAVTDPKI